MRVNKTSRFCGTNLERFRVKCEVKNGHVFWRASSRFRWVYPAGGAQNIRPKSAAWLLRYGYIPSNMEVHADCDYNNCVQHLKLKRKRICTSTSSRIAGRGDKGHWQASHPNGMTG